MARGRPVRSPRTPSGRRQSGRRRPVRAPAASAPRRPTGPRQRRQDQSPTQRDERGVQPHAALQRADRAVRLPAEHLGEPEAIEGQRERGVDREDLTGRVLRLRTEARRFPVPGWVDRRSFGSSGFRARTLGELGANCAVCLPRRALGARCRKANVRIDRAGAKRANVGDARSANTSRPSCKPLSPVRFGRASLTQRMSSLHRPTAPVRFRSYAAVQSPVINAEAGPFVYQVCGRPHRAPLPHLHGNPRRSVHR